MYNPQRVSGNLATARGSEGPSDTSLLNAMPWWRKSIRGLRVLEILVKRYLSRI